MKLPGRQSSFQARLPCREDDPQIPDSQPMVPERAAAWFRNRLHLLDQRLLKDALKRNGEHASRSGDQLASLRHATSAHIAEADSWLESRG
jgi:hypothetical protein